MTCEALKTAGAIGASGGRGVLWTEGEALVGTHLFDHGERRTV
jgi:hypothetical protein